MNRIKFLLATTISILALNLSLFALPSVKQFLPDASGQFVYYKDSSFARESYVGVIYYDDSTYGFRYVAPAVNDKKSKLPKLEMQIFITIDPNKRKLEFTGEKVEPFPRNQEETDIINYLHDFAYEMTERRQNLEDTVGSLKEKVVDRQDYAQFGGTVDVEYDPVVPIFNVRKITNLENKTVLNCVTAGRLISSEDTTFSGFDGIPSKIADTKHSFKNKKMKPSKITLENEGFATQSFNLDAQWEQKGNAIWMLGNSAVITTTSLNFPSNFSTYESLFLLRTLLLGGDHSYPDWASQKINFADSGISIQQTFYDPQNGSLKYDFKEVKSLGKQAKSVFSLAVFAGSYKPNKKYFDSILESYKIEN